MSLEPSDSRSPYTLSLLITLDAFPKQIKATHGMLGRGMALYSSNSFLHQRLVERTSDLRTLRPTFHQSKHAPHQCLRKDSTAHERGLINADGGPAKASTCPSTWTGGQPENRFYWKSIEQFSTQQSLQSLRSSRF